MNVQVIIDGKPDEIAPTLAALFKVYSNGEEQWVDRESFRPRAVRDSVPGEWVEEGTDKSGSPRAAAVDQPEAVESDDEPAPAPVKKAAKPERKVAGSIPAKPKPAAAPVATKPAPASASRDDAKNAMEAFAKANSAVELVKKLGEFGARKLSDIPEDKLSDFVAALNFAS